MEIEEVDPNATCCANCKWFDQRTCFCRKNPPQVVMQYVNRMAYPNAVFPKVPMPALDWCAGFEKDETKI